MGSGLVLLSCDFSGGVRTPCPPSGSACKGICLNLCILGIFNRNIWNANSNGSGQTCDVQSHQDLCRSLKLKFARRIEWLHKKVYHKFTIYLNVKYCKQYRPGEISCYEVSGSTL